MKLVVRPGVHPYFDVVDIAPKHAPGSRVIRASYCTKPEADLFASAPALQERVAKLEKMWCVRLMLWVEHVLKAAHDGLGSMQERK